MRLILAILFFSFLGNLTSHAQDSTKYKKASVIYFKEDNNISRIKFNKDTTEAFFRIVHKGMETEEKRNKAIENHRKKGLPFPNFYTDFSAVSKPERICSLSNLNYITVEEFRKGNYTFTQLVTVIYRLRDGKYLKWENALFMAYQ